MEGLAIDQLGELGWKPTRGEPIPEEIQRMLGRLIAEPASAGEVLDIYDAAGMPKPSLDDLTPEFMVKAQKARNPQLAIKALRKLISDESAKTMRNNPIPGVLGADRGVDAKVHQSAAVLSRDHCRIGEAGTRGGGRSRAWEEL